MKLSDAELDVLFDRLGISPQGRALVRQIRTSPPARRVQGHGRNRTLRMPSAKMGMTIQAESGTLEAPAIVGYERDEDVLEFYDQPCTLALPYARAGTSRQTIAHTPDFLLIGRSAIRFDEWKYEDKLQKLALEDPQRWVEAEGVWCHLPARTYLASLGIGHHVRTERSFSSVLVRNLELLADFYAGTHVVAPARREAVLDLVRAREGISLAAALETIADLQVDDVFAMLADQSIWTDLSREVLTRHERVLLFSDQLSGSTRLAPMAAVVDTGEVPLERETRLLWDGNPWTIANVGPTLITLQSETEGGMSTLRLQEFEKLVRTGSLCARELRRATRADQLVGVSAAQLKMATARESAIRPYLESGETPEQRTLRRWIEDFRRAKTTLGDGLLGLVAGYDACGRTPYLPANAISLADAVIEEILLNGDNASERSAHRIYEKRCRDQGIAPMGRTSFRDRVHLVSAERRAKARMGYKAAHAASMPAKRAVDLPVQGDRVFARAYVDHTQFDLETVDSQTGEPNGRPWLTIARDAYSGRALGHVLLHDRPSTTTLMLLLRDIVRRYGRLPATFATDNGSDFTSTYWQTTCAAFGVSVEYRPGGAPRFGSAIERMFRKIETDLVHQMRGNTQTRKNVRASSREVDASTRAVWPLAELDNNLSQYLYEAFDKDPHHETGLSPRQVFERSLQESGHRAGALIQYNEAFRIMTAPEPPRPLVRVGRQGVRILGLRYMCDAFRRPGVEGTKVEVRYEPLNRGIAYAKLGDTWHQCQSSYYTKFQGRSEKEIHIASQELTQHLRREPTLTELVRHLDATKTTERELLARRRAAEQRRALAETEGLAVPGAEPIHALEPTGTDVEDVGEIVELAAWEPDDEPTPTTQDEDAA